MKLLDRYIIKQFLLTALFGIVAFTIIFVVIDLMEKLDDFLDKKAAAMIIVQYLLDAGWYCSPGYVVSSPGASWYLVEVFER